MTKEVLKGLMLIRFIEIQTNSIDDATEKVAELYRTQNIVLTESDFVDVDFQVCEENTIN